MLTDQPKEKVPSAQYSHLCRTAGYAILLCIMSVFICHLNPMGTLSVSAINSFLTTTSEMLGSMPKKIVTSPVSLPRSEPSLPMENFREPFR